MRIYEVRISKAAKSSHFLFMQIVFLAQILKPYC